MKLILNGGGIGKTVSNARQILNQCVDCNKKILYIPLAWPDSTYNGCLEFMSKELRDVKCAGIDMVTSKEELISKNFSDYACIYIGGGNTYKLLKDLKDSGAFNKIKKYLLDEDGIVYGGSAGAIIFGKDIELCSIDDINEVGLKDNSGFDLIGGFSLLCHYTNRDADKTILSTNYLLKLSKQKKIYAIPEEDTIFVNNDKINIIGTRPFYVFEDGIKYEKTPQKIYKNDSMSK